MLDIRQELKEQIENCYCGVLEIIIPKLNEGWKTVLHDFVVDQYKQYKSNYEAIYKYYQNSDPNDINVLSFDGTAMSTLLLYFPPFKNQLNDDSMPKQLNDYIRILRDSRNRVEHYKITIDESKQRDFYYDQFNALACVTAFSSMMMKFFPSVEKWGKILQTALSFQRRFLGERWNYISRESKTILKSSENFSELLLSAENGDVTSQIKVAKAYYYGDRVGQDEGKAYYWFYKAGKLGNCPEAWYYIGECYRSIGSVDTDFEKSKTYIQKAADAGVPEALNDIAIELFAKPNKSKEEIRYLYSIIRQAADKDYAPAVRHLSLLYRAGIGVKKDEDTANSLLIKAALLGETLACQELAEYSREKKNTEDEIKWLNEAVKNGDRSSAYRLQKLKRETQLKAKNQ